MARFALGTSFHLFDDPEQGRLIEQTARWFGTPTVIVYQNEGPGLLPSERSGSAGSRSVLSSAGASVQPDGVRYDRHGMLAATIHTGQLRGEITPIDHHRDNTQVKAAMVDRACFTPSPLPSPAITSRSCPAASG